MITKQIDTALIRKLDHVKNYIGNTPLHPITHLTDNKDVKIYAKLEWEQFGSSVKSRAAFSIIQHGIYEGLLDTNKVLLDATSGNTGIAYASICAALDIKLTLCLPENASEERKKILKTLGAELILTSPYESTEGAQEVARKLNADNPDKYYYADQYSNDNNWKAHYHTTANEIYHQTNGKVTHFVAGLGTSGTMTGTGRKLKELNNQIKLIALQPDLAMHGMEGWKHMETAGAPAIYDDTLPDEICYVSTEDAFEMIIQANDYEGILISPSAAANLSGAIELANKLEEGVIVTILPDNADKYSEIVKELFK